MLDFEPCDVVKKITSKVTLSLSLGKDSLASYLRLAEKGFEIFPRFHYWVPDFPPDLEYLHYFERFTGTKVARYPHPDFIMMLASEELSDLNSVVRSRLADPHNTMEHISVDWEDMRAHHMNSLGLDPTTTYNAVGVKMADSLRRRINLKQYGTVDRNKRIFYPCWDMKDRDVIALLKKHNMKIPRSYRYHGSSFDGYAAHFMWPMFKDHPKDFAHIKKYFPRVEAIVWREIYKRRRLIDAL